MGKTKKPRKPYQSRSVMHARRLRFEPWRLPELFGPVEMILDRIEAEEAFEVAEDGLPTVHFAVTGEMLPVSGLFPVLAEIFVIAAHRTLGACPGVEPLHLFADKLDQEADITEAGIQSCRTCLAALRRYAETLHFAELQDLMQIAMLKVAMDEAEDFGSADTCLQMNDAEGKSHAV